MKNWAGNSTHILFFQVKNRQYFCFKSLKIQNPKSIQTPMFFFSVGFWPWKCLVRSEVYFDLSMLLRSFARSDVATFVGDATYMDLLLLLHNLARLGVPPAILTACRIGVFLMVLGAVNLGSVPFLQSFAYVDSALLVSSCIDLDLLLFLQGLSWPNSSSFAVGISCSNFSILIFDLCQVDLSISTRSHSRIALAMFAPGLAQLDFSTLLQQFAHLNLFLPLCGHMSFDFSVPISDCLNVDFSLLAHSFSHMEFILFIVDTNQVDISMSIHSFTRSELSMLLMNFVALGLSSSIRGSGRSELLLFVSGLSCVDFLFFLSIISSSIVGSLLPSQSFAHSDSSLLLLDHASLDPSIFPRKMAHLDFTITIFGTSCVEFPLFILAAGYLDFFSSLQSVLYPEFSISLVSTRLGLSAAVLDFTALDFSLSLHSLCRLDVSSFLCGAASSGFVSSMSVLKATTLDSFILLHGFGHLEFLVLIFDMVKVEILLLPHNFAYLDLSFLVLGAGCIHTLHLTSSLFVLSSSLLGFLLLVHSLACLDLLSLMLSNLQMALPMSLQSSSYLDAFMSLLGALELESFNWGGGCIPTTKTWNPKMVGFYTSSQ